MIYPDRLPTDSRTQLKLKPEYSAKLEALMPAYRARSKAHLLEMLIDDAQLTKQRQYKSSLWTARVE